MSNRLKCVFISAIILALICTGYSQDFYFNKRGCSYYPRDAAWDNMWTNFDPMVINQDFAELKALGCNFVRIMLRPHVCGFPGRGAQFTKFVENMEIILELASKHNLSVHVLLFDNLRPQDFIKIDSSKVWIDKVVSAKAKDLRIFRWELFSEINLVCRENDPDTATVVNWYKNMMAYLKLKKGNHQQATVSVGVVDNAYLECKFYNRIVDLAPQNLPDVYGLVFTKYAFLFPAIYDTIRSIIRKNDPDPNKEIIISELAWDTYIRTELFQQDQFRNVFYYFKKREINDVSIWILWDFTKQELPELKEIKQHYFGLRRIDGSYKPAYDVIYSAFNHQKLTYNLSNPSFEVIHDTLANNNVYPAALPDSWAKWKGSNNSTGIVEVTNEAAFIGNNSLMMSKTNSGGIGSYYEQGIPVIPGKAYKLRAFTKTINATGRNIISIVWHKSHIFENMTWAGNDANSISVDGTKDWTMLEVYAQAPNSCILAQPYCKSMANQGQVYFDYLSFTPIYSLTIGIDYKRNPQIDFVDISLEKYIEPYQAPKVIKFKNSGTIKTQLDEGWYLPTLQVHFQNKTFFTLTKEMIFIDCDTTITYEIGIDPESSASTLSVFPNPFNNSTTIQYMLENSSEIELSIYNTIGEKVIELISGKRNQGLEKIRWNGCNNYGLPVAAGVYFLKFQSKNFCTVKKLLIVR